MSTVTEIKSAAERLSDDERWELYRWLRSKEETRQLEELRREIAVGIEQANCGEVAPLDTEKTLAEVRRQLRDSK